MRLFLIVPWRESVVINDILVHIPTERPMRAVIDASISLARGFGAHLDALGRPTNVR
jgi:hypothetical protein